jgi:hypothetical protein
MELEWVVKEHSELERSFAELAARSPSNSSNRSLVADRSSQELGRKPERQALGPSNRNPIRRSNRKYRSRRQGEA